MKLILVILITAAAVFPAAASLKIYLYPRVETDGLNMTMEHIAWVEGDEEETGKSRKIQIAESLYKDGFVDRREILNIMKDAGFADFSIIGNSVRITRSSGDRKEKEKLERAAAHAVKKGDSVTVLIKSKRITLETKGIVTREAFPGDEIQVELDKKRSVKGILREEKTVEVKI